LYILKNPIIDNISYQVVSSLLPNMIKFVMNFAVKNNEKFSPYIIGAGGGSRMAYVNPLGAHLCCGWAKNFCKERAESPLTREFSRIAAEKDCRGG